MKSLSRPSNYFEPDTKPASVWRGQSIGLAVLSVNNWGPGETVIDTVYVGSDTMPATYKIVPGSFSLVK